MRHPNVRNADEVEAREMIKGRHNMRLRQLGKPAGSLALGATLTEVAPGAVSFPRHAHHANEEAIYVLHAFEKRARKTPDRDLEIARRRLAEVARHRQAR